MVVVYVVVIVVCVVCVVVVVVITNMQFTCRHLEIPFWALVNLLRWQVCVPIDSHDVSCVFSNLSSARNFYRNLAIRICTACLRCECAYASPDGPNIERGLIKQVYENNATSHAPELKNSKANKN